MKKRLWLVVSLAMLLTLAVSLPALAGEDVGFKVNGEPVTFAGLYLEDGYSMIAAGSFARLTGAKVDGFSENTFKIAKAGTELSLTVGSREAQLGDKAVTLPVEPVQRGGEVFVPLRFVSTAFGFEVGWDAAQRTVLLTLNETRDGLTPAELLAKSNLASQDYNAYAMEGAFDMDLVALADGVKQEDVPGKVTTKISGQIQNSPMQVYMKQTLAPVSAETPEMTVEIYMTEEKMYMKAPGQEWTAQPMPFPAEFWKQQQDIQSDPLKAAAFMKEMGLFLNYGDDISLAGEDYYVVNTSLDMNKFRQGYQKMIQQVMQNMPQGAAGSPEEMQQVMQKMLENMELEYYYTVYVNKKTMITDIVKMDARMGFDLPAPAEAGQEGAAAKEVKMNINMRGEFKISSLGEPFQAPDVSKAVEVEVPGT